MTITSVISSFFSLVRGIFISLILRKSTCNADKIKILLWRRYITSLQQCALFRVRFTIRYTVCQNSVHGYYNCRFQGWIQYFGLLMGRSYERATAEEVSVSGASSLWNIKNSLVWNGTEEKETDRNITVIHKRGVVWSSLHPKSVVRWIHAWLSQGPFIITRPANLISPDFISSELCALRFVTATAN